MNGDIGGEWIGTKTTAILLKADQQENVKWKRYKIEKISEIKTEDQGMSRVQLEPTN